jgi:V/A-type H+-transporting ATPase subunit F
VKYYLIADDELALTGMRFAGVEGEVVTDPAAARSAAEKAVTDSDIAVLLVTTGVEALIPDTVGRMKLSGRRPLLAVIPSPGAEGLGSDSITDLIRQAIGVKI